MAHGSVSVRGPCRDEEPSARTRLFPAREGRLRSSKEPHLEEPRTPGRPGDYSDTLWPPLVFYLVPVFRPEVRRTTPARDCPARGRDKRTGRDGNVIQDTGLVVQSLLISGVSDGGAEKYMIGKNIGAGEGGCGTRVPFAVSLTNKKFSPRYTDKKYLPNNNSEKDFLFYCRNNYYSFDWIRSN